MRISRIWLAVIASFLCLWPATAKAQGIMQPGAGAMHLSMAGASTAVGVDALGALYWNPAVIGGLSHSEVVIGSTMILPDIHVASMFQGQGGETRSDSGFVPTTSVGLVYKPEDSFFTYGLAINTLAAGGVNYPGDVSNPILAPRGPIAGLFVLGPQAASLLVLGIEPTVSVQVTDRLVMGAGPMVDVSLVSFDPAFFGPPSGIPREFPTGSHSEPFWGGGFRFGTTYKVTNHLVAGFSYTSPQWFDTWRFNARDANGDPLLLLTHFSLPQIFSLGVSYDGIERLLVSADVRWFDYRTTQLLGQPVAQGGANWDSIWAVAVGARYLLSDRLSAQAGYIFNENPVPSQQAFFNSELPLINQHTLTLGGYYQLNDSIGISAAWMHGFHNTLTGSLLPVLGASTTLKSEFDAFALGIHVVFGASCCKCGCANHAAPAAETPPAAN